MISFTVRMKFLPEDREAIHECLRELTSASRKEPGCVSYIPHIVETDPTSVLIYEQYRDDAALDAHRATPHFERWANQGLYPRLQERSVEMLLALA